MKTDIKNYITEALFELLKTKELKNIKIVELVKLTGISRTSFYNNFNNINEVLKYKFDNIIKDIKKIILLNKLRNKDFKNLILDILNYLKNNKNVFVIIKKNFFFDFKNRLDKKLYHDDFKYYIKTGIIINLCLLYLDNNFNLDLEKIKID